MIIIYSWMKYLNNLFKTKWIYRILDLQKIKAIIFAHNKSWNKVFNLNLKNNRLWIIHLILTFLMVTIRVIWAFIMFKMSIAWILISKKKKLNKVFIAMKYQNCIHIKWNNVTNQKLIQQWVYRRIIQI